MRHERATVISGSARPATVEARESSVGTRLGTSGNCSLMSHPSSRSRAHKCWNGGTTVPKTTPVIDAKAWRPHLGLLNKWFDGTFHQRPAGASRRRREPASLVRRVRRSWDLTQPHGQAIGALIPPGRRAMEATLRRINPVLSTCCAARHKQHVVFKGGVDLAPC